MSATGLEIFDTTIQETNLWLRLMMGEPGTDDRRAAFNALRAAPAEAAGACFAVMGRCLHGGEMLKLRGLLPHEALNLWPDAMLQR